MIPSINDNPSKRLSDTSLNQNEFTLFKKRRTETTTDTAVSTVAQATFAAAAASEPATLPVAAPAPENAYKEAYDEITAPQFDADTGEIYKQITIRDKTYKSLTGSIGSGDSLMAFRCIELNSEPARTVIIKVFNFPLFKTKRRLADTAQLTERMNLLKSNYKAALELGVPSAEIYNLETLSSDGCILQESLDPIGSSVPWANESELLEGQKTELEAFCAILEKAIQSADRKSWDLSPKNFGRDQESSLKLFDFSDQPLHDQWADFHKALKEWIGSNQAAKELVLAKLAAMPGDPNIIALQNKINGPL